MPLAVALIDRLDTLNFTEKLGVIRSMTRKARVILDPTLRATDFSALSQALTVCPKFFSTLANEGYGNLVLVERSPAIAESDPCCVDVILKYEHILDGPNQVLLGSLNQIGTFGKSWPLLYSKGRCSIVEKNTNFYYPYGDDTQPKVLIQTGHQYDPNDQGLPGLIVNNKKNPYSVLQGGEVSIPFPQENFELVGVVATTDPRGLARSFVAKVNLNDWLGKPPFTWLCSEAKWEVLDSRVNPPTYKFSFEFQYSIDTWFPAVVFNDQRTGRPPFDVALGNVPDPNIGVFNVDLPNGGQVFSYVLNKENGVEQPAGYWSVPALQPVNFLVLFQKFFE